MLLAQNLRNSVLDFIAQVADDYTELMDAFISEQDTYHQGRVDEIRLSFGGGGESTASVLNDIDKKQVECSIRDLTDVMAKQSKDYESRMSAESTAISQRLAKILCTLSSAYQVSLNPQMFKK